MSDSSPLRQRRTFAYAAVLCLLALFGAACGSSSDERLLTLRSLSQIADTRQPTPPSGSTCTAFAFAVIDKQDIKSNRESGFVNTLESDCANDPMFDHLEIAEFVDVDSAEMVFNLIDRGSGPQSDPERVEISPRGSFPGSTVCTRSTDRYQREIDSYCAVRVGRFVFSAQSKPVSLDASAIPAEPGLKFLIDWARAAAKSSRG